MRGDGVKFENIYPFEKYIFYKKVELSPNGFESIGLPPFPRYGWGGKYYIFILSWNLVMLFEILKCLRQNEYML